MWILVLGASAAIFGYWAWVWAPAAEWLPQVALQLGVAYLIDRAVQAMRAGEARLDFEPAALVLRINLFVWFEALWLQLVMVALAVCVSRLVPRRDAAGLVLAVAALAVVSTGSESLTRGAEIAAAMDAAPRMLEAVFVCGLIIGVGLPTLCATLAGIATFLLGGPVFWACTETHLFIDAALPVTVLLAATLLLSHPGSAPSTTAGRLLYGALWGAGVFAAVLGLRANGTPVFAAPLLVGPLVETVGPWLAIERPRLPTTRAIWVSIWSGVFVVMMAMPKALDVAAWHDACDADRIWACENLAALYSKRCEAGDARACHGLGVMVRNGRGVEANAERALELFDVACRARVAASCNSQGAILLARGDPRSAHDALRLFAKACDEGDAPGCNNTGIVLNEGRYVQRNVEQAKAAFNAACDDGFGPSCNELGLLVITEDRAAAISLFERACLADNVAGCTNSKRLAEGVVWQTK